MRKARALLGRAGVFAEIDFKRCDRPWAVAVFVEVEQAVGSCQLSVIFCYESGLGEISAWYVKYIDATFLLNKYFANDIAHGTAAAIEAELTNYGVHLSKLAGI